MIRTGSTTRRGILGAAAGLAGVAASGGAQASTVQTAPPPGRSVPFFGAHQAGITTPMPAHTYFAAFDVRTDKRAELAEVLRAWTDAAAKLTQGAPLESASGDVEADSREAQDLPGTSLTLTFGLGPGLFSQDGVDRFGLVQQRPAAFVDLPNFTGDQLVPERTGGDLSVQACSNDQQACLHAVRHLGRIAAGAVSIRWVQAGFIPRSDPKLTPRNLMGFKDGTGNINSSDAKALDQLVWVGGEGGPWMRGGSYLVVRPIRIALEHWDKMKLAFQEQTVGRHKASGAPIGAKHEFAPADLAAVDADGNPVIAENAHLRLASPLSNGGAQILRRGYSYDNGVAMVAERWPPWRHAMEMDAGLLFICYQRDPANGFVKIFDRMSKFDMMNQFVTTIGGGLFACPGGVAKGRFLAQGLFESA